MPSIINAALSGGLISTADTSGVLQLQTASTTALTVDTSANIGIGTASPSYKLHVVGLGTGAQARIESTSTANAQLSFVNTSATGGFVIGLLNNTSGDALIYHQDAKPIGFYTGGIERLRIPSNSGGITFPATQSASSDANTLDDYEEGTWTPTYYGSTTAGTTTYGGRHGIYVKIGRTVYIECDLSWSARTGTGDGLIGGLPFTVNAYSPTDARALFYIGAYSGYSITGTLSGIVQSNGTNIILYANNNGSLAGSGMQNSGEVRFQFYYTASN